MSNSGWNRSSSNQPKVAKKSGTKFSLLHGLIAGVVVVVLGFAVLAIFSGGEDAPKAKAEKDRGLIKAATPAPAPTNKVAEAKKERPKDPHAGMRLASNGVWQPADRPYYPGRKYVHEVKTNRMYRANKSIARNTVEQIMLQIFTRERGDLPLPLPASIPERDMKRLVEILIDKHEATDKDSETVAISKEILNNAKSEMMKYIKEGGAPEDFLTYYHDELERSFYRRRDAQLYVQKLVNEGETPQFINDFVDKMNEKLEADGIKTISKPQEIEEALEAGTLKSGTEEKKKEENRQ